MNKWCDRSLKTGAECWRDSSGSVIIMFGLIVMIIFGCSAIAIDFARVNRSRSLAMMALDSAALATAKQLRLEGGSADELIREKRRAECLFASCATTPIL